MTIAELIYREVDEFANFVRTPISLAKKIQIFCVMISQSINLSTKRFFGFEIAKDFNDKAHLKNVFLEVFYRGSYYFKTEKENPIIIDAGANVGITTLYYHWLYPKSEIHSFEPNSNYLTATLHDSLPLWAQVKIIPCALSNSNGKITFYENGAVGVSSIYGVAESQKRLVQCIKLSDYIKMNISNRIDMLKMDIEGAEYNVLVDLHQSKVIQRVDKIVMEYHHKLFKQKSRLATVLYILEQNGFEYQIQAFIFPISINKPQNVMIFAQRKK